MNNAHASLTRIRLIALYAALSARMSCSERVHDPLVILTAQIYRPKIYSGGHFIYIHLAKSYLFSSYYFFIEKSLIRPLVLDHAGCVILSFSILRCCGIDPSYNQFYSQGSCAKAGLLC